MATEVNCKNLKTAQNESIVESTDSEERSETSVEVKAQVMKRGDAGWIPIDGGGLSVVGLSTYPTEDNAEEVQYRVNAKRVKDNASLLSCILRKDLAYTKGNPLFHHWQTQGQRFGLTFHSSTDASTFEQWISNAKQNLLGSNSNCEKSDQVCEDLLSQDAIMIARLVKDTVSLPGSRARTPSPGASNRVNARHSSVFLASHPSSYPALHDPRLTTRRRKPGTCRRADANGGEERRKMERDQLSVPEFSTSVEACYVQFSRSEPKANCNNFHDYFYPTGTRRIDWKSKRASHPELHDCQRRRRRLPASGSFGGSATAEISAAELRPTKKVKKRKKCDGGRRKNSQSTSRSGDFGRHHRAAGGHRPGRRQGSNDRGGRCLEGCPRCLGAAPCVDCAGSVLYRLAASDDDDEDERGTNRRGVCSCEEGRHGNARKWLALTLLSIFLPCFWCYAPIDGCRRCRTRRPGGHKSE